MRRRRFIQAAGGTAFAAFIPAAAPKIFAGQPKAKSAPGLFFDPADIDKIRRNSRTPLLKAYASSCINADLEADRKALRTVPGTKDLFRSLRETLPILQRESLAYLLTSDRRRVPFILECLDVFLGMPEWEYFIASGRRLGLQLAPKSIISLLFARECLGDALDAKRQQRLLSKVAEEGCVPCYNALWDMDNKESVKDWTFDPKYDFSYEIDMRRWPVVLDRTNLKAIPVGGLGLGALALMDSDARAPGWLQLAERSAKEFLDLLSPDGAYFEGLSYADYSFQNLFIFFEAHRRIKGTIDWFDMANFYGFSEYMAYMQLGRTPEDDAPDIVNFSDAKRSVTPSVAMWVANQGQDGLAQYAAEQFSQYNRFTDLIWYDPELKPTLPPVRLQNVRTSLDWIICRSGWEKADSIVAFRSGGPANHEHADRNSFIFKSHGERLLTDPFGAAYDWRQPNWLLRLTGAHNAVLIDGKGHQYHKGEEGTNSSKSAAHVLRFADRENIVSWSSDATPAYQLVDRRVQRVLRSMLFIKPSTLVVVDTIEMHQDSASVSVRFHPDNRDLRARVTADGASFLIERPKAWLKGRIATTADAHVRVAHLDLPESDGVFPFAEVSTAEVSKVTIVSALVAGPAATRPAELSISGRAEAGWTITDGAHRIRIEMNGSLPEFHVEV